MCAACGGHERVTSHHRAGLHLKCQQDPGHATKSSCSRRNKSLFREIITSLTPKESGAQKVFLYQTRIGDSVGRLVRQTQT